MLEVMPTTPPPHQVEVLVVVVLIKTRLELQMHLLLKEIMEGLDLCMEVGMVVVAVVALEVLVEMEVLLLQELVVMD